MENRTDQIILIAVTLLTEHEIIEFKRKLLGRKWSEDVLICLLSKNKRFGGLKNCLIEKDKNITDKMLGKILKSFLKEGLVKKVSSYASEHQCDYELTKKGRQIAQHLKDTSDLLLEKNSEK